MEEEAFWRCGHLVGYTGGSGCGWLATGGLVCSTLLSWHTACGSQTYSSFLGVLLRCWQWLFLYTVAWGRAMIYGGPDVVGRAAYG